MFEKQLGDFPGGPVVESPPCNVWDAGSIPGQRTKIPRAMGPLSPRATTAELSSLSGRAHVLQTTEPTHSGAHMPQLVKRKPTHCNERSHMPQQRFCVPQLRADVAKNKFKKIMQLGNLGSFLWISRVFCKEATFSIPHATLRSFIAKLAQSPSSSWGKTSCPRG